MACRMPAIFRDLGQHALRAGALAFRRLRRAAPLGIELRDERFDELGRHQPVLEAGEHARFDLVAADRHRVGARALGAPRMMSRAMVRPRPTPLR